MKATRMQDVAGHAGVSTATVSRVLGGAEYVSDALRQRVEAAVLALGYHPNRVARRLRQPHGGMWALIVPDLQNQFFTSIASGIEEVASELGITVFVGNTNFDSDRQRQYIEVALAEQVAGIFLAPTSNDDDVLALVESGIPFITVDQQLPGVDALTVMTDHHAGGLMAGSALRSCGYRDIAVIASPEVDPTWNTRLTGLQDGFLHDDRRIVKIERGDNRIDGGRAAAVRILEQHPETEALFVTNNLMTIGALRELDSRRISIPADLGIIGYDLASSVLARANPITSVNQNPRELGSIAADRMISHHHDLTLGAETILLPPTIEFGPDPDLDGSLRVQTAIEVR